MNPISAQFEVKSGLYRSNLKMRGREWAESASVFVAIHDMLEHSPTDTGSIEEELTALGVGCFLRYERFYAFGRDNFYRSMTNDVYITLAHYWPAGGMKNPPIVSDDELLFKGCPVGWSRLLHQLQQQRNDSIIRVDPARFTLAMGWLKYGWMVGLARYAGIYHIGMFRHFHDALLDALNGKRTYDIIEVTLLPENRQISIKDIIEAPDPADVSRAAYVRWLSARNQTLDTLIKDDVMRAILAL